MNRKPPHDLGLECGLGVRLLADQTGDVAAQVLACGARLLAARLEPLNLSEQGGDGLVRLCNLQCQSAHSRPRCVGM